MRRFHLFLGNPAGLAFNWQELAEAVLQLLLPALPFTADFNRVRVRSTMTRPTLAPGDVVVYVVRSQFSSIVGRRLGVDPQPHHGGLTVPRNGVTGSEAYLRGSSIEQSARVIVHELLHNKTGIA